MNKEQSKEISSPTKATPPPLAQRRTKVVITLIDIPFGDLVNFMVKVAIASVPAFIILVIIYFIVITFIGGLLT